MPTGDTVEMAPRPCSGRNCLSDVSICDLKVAPQVACWIDSSSNRSADYMRGKSGSSDCRADDCARIPLYREVPEYAHIRKPFGFLIVTTRL